jgi:hypothetical protein
VARQVERLAVVALVKRMKKAGMFPAFVLMKLWYHAIAE